MCNRHHLILPFLALLAIVAIPWSALAQTQVTIYGVVDGGRPGVVRPVAVDSNGRLLSNVSISPSPFATTTVCSATAEDVTSVGTTAVATPAAQLASRTTVLICNSLQNTGNPLVKCRSDGVPIMASGNAGQVLSVGDCITYRITDAVTPQCISDTAATQVTSLECAP